MEAFTCKTLFFSTWTCIDFVLAHDVQTKSSCIPESLGGEPVSSGAEIAKTKTNRRKNISQLSTQPNQKKIHSPPPKGRRTTFGDNRRLE